MSFPSQQQQKSNFLSLSKSYIPKATNEKKTSACQERWNVQTVSPLVSTGELVTIQAA
jgi:hypothetical protein